MAENQGHIGSISIGDRNEYEGWSVGTKQLVDIIAKIAQEKSWTFDTKPTKVEGVDEIIGALATGKETYIVGSVRGEGRYGGDAITLYGLNGRRILLEKDPSQAVEVLKILREPIDQAIAEEEQKALSFYGITEWPDSDP